MDIMRFWARMLCCQNGSDHGHHEVLGMDALLATAVDHGRHLVLGMDALLANAIDHGRHEVLGMDALLANEIDHGHHEVLGMDTLLATQSTMDVIWFWAWMLSSQSGSDHGRH